MTDKGLQYTEDYTADFDPQSYLEIFEEPNPNTTRGLQTSLNLTAFHHAYASGKTASLWPHAFSNSCQIITTANNAMTE